jgi:hypothetical protein
MLLTIAACLGLAALSLLLPSEPSYDPWAWFVWAREITHLELDTHGGPSWKPLPVALLTVAAPFGDELPVALWVVLARAGALLALVLAFRLAARLTGGPTLLASWPARSRQGRSCSPRIGFSSPRTRARRRWRWH